MGSSLSTTEEVSVVGAVVRFLVPGLIAFALVAVIAALALREAAIDEAIADARRVTEVAASGIIEPNLPRGIEGLRPGAAEALDRVVRRALPDRDFVRVKLWTERGVIAYSDEPRLIGSRYTLGEDELATLRSGGVEAELSDLSQPENRFERQAGELLEVYLPVRAPSGRTLLFEAYLPFSAVAASGAEVWRAMAPGLIASLALLELFQLPLAWRMARNLRQRQREREGLLRAAIESSELERRRIASDLHDGAVQQLAGMSMSLTGSAERLRRDGNEQLADVLAQVASGARQSVRELRTLLMDLYPTSLRTAGLETALRQAAAPLLNKGCNLHIDAPHSLRLPPDTEALLFRTAQEALRNAVSHAHASEIWIEVARNNGHAGITIRDDGRGMAPDELQERRAQGHMGLELLRQLVEDAGGRLAISSEPGQGTTLRVEVPAP
jgi:signal transduction histidine kinase